MKYVKSKNLLVASILSIFFVQITNSVYSPTPNQHQTNTKPTFMSAAKPIVTPITKPATVAAKSTLKAAQSVTIQISINDSFTYFAMSGMNTPNEWYTFSKKDIDNLNYLKNNGPADDPTISGTLIKDKPFILTNHISTSICSTNPNNFVGTTATFSYFLASDPTKNLTINANAGDTIKIVVMSPIITIPSGDSLTSFVMSGIDDATDSYPFSDSDINNLNNAISKGQTISGTLTKGKPFTLSNGTDIIFSTGSYNFVGTTTTFIYVLKNLTPGPFIRHANAGDIIKIIRKS